MKYLIIYSADQPWVMGQEYIDYLDRCSNGNLIDVRYTRYSVLHDRTLFEDVLNQIKIDADARDEWEGGKAPLCIILYRVNDKQNIISDLCHVEYADNYSHACALVGDNVLIRVAPTTYRIEPRKWAEEVAYPVNETRGSDYHTATIWYLKNGITYAAAG